MRKGFVAGVLLSCCACQTYMPVALSPDAAGGNVRVTLTSAGSAASFGKLGSGVGQLEGRFGALSDSALTMSVVQVNRLSGSEDGWDGESVTIPRSDVASIERRRTSVSRTLLLAGAIVGGTFWISQSTGAGTQSGSSGGRPPIGRQ